LVGLLIEDNLHITGKCQRWFIAMIKIVMRRTSTSSSGAMLIVVRKTISPSCRSNSTRCGREGNLAVIGVRHGGLRRQQTKACH
jgi:hypothetical protein